MVKGKSKGFTLIEIVLVLAIAGLLIIVVFLAISGAQKARRDAQRKHDLARLATQVELYASAHKGVYPTPDNDANTGFTNGFTNNYLPDNFVDPKLGQDYDLGIMTPAACNPNANLNGNGVGSITYDRPGNNGYPYKLRICLEQGAFYIGN